MSSAMSSPSPSSSSSSSSSSACAKASLPSRHVSVGASSAPHRSYYYAMGMTAEEIAQPFVGVATCWNEAAPCNIALDRQAAAVKQGVKAAKGTPREFTTITVTDGIAMGHQGMKSSLVSRDLIADSVELTIRGHCYDALVGIAGCDKSLPGMMMAMLRLNVPSVFLYGGSILPGRYKGRDITVQDVFEAVGKHAVGAIDDETLHAIECVACPSAGSCGGQFTANTMACVSEAIGLALPGSAGTPAPYESRDAFARRAGESVMMLIENNIKPRDIVTREALENAARIVAASGGSTNAALHLPAIAHECGIDFDLHEVCRIFRETPYIADLKPSGRYVALDLYRIGGVPVLMRALLDAGLLHEDCLTVSGKTIGENLAGTPFPCDQDVVRPCSAPLSATGGVVGLRGNLASEGAIVKIAGMERLRFVGRARVFDCEEAAYEAEFFSYGIADFLRSFGVDVGVCVEGVEDALRRVVLADDVVASSCEAVGEPAVFADALPCLARLRQRGVAAEQDSTRGVLGGGGSCFGRLVLLLRRLGLKLRFGLRLRLRLRRRGDDAGAREVSWN